MPDKPGESKAGAKPLSRRDSVKLAAIAALGTGLGVPHEALGLSPGAARLQVKFFKGATDGGALLGAFDLTDLVTTYLRSASGIRTQVKWYEVTAGELGSMSIPTMIQDKIRLLASGE